MYFYHTDIMHTVAFILSTFLTFDMFTFPAQIYHRIPQQVNVDVGACGKCSENGLGKRQRFFIAGAAAAAAAAVTTTATACCEGFGGGTPCVVPAIFTFIRVCLLSASPLPPSGPTSNPDVDLVGFVSRYGGDSGAVLRLSVSGRRLWMGKLALFYIHAAMIRRLKILFVFCSIYCSTYQTVMPCY